MLKSYLFEILAEQEIDMDILINGIKMNPKVNGSIFDNENIVMTIEMIPTFFEKNPAQAELAIEQFQQFILITYPGVPDNPEQFAYNISEIVKSMFHDRELTETQLKMKKILEETN